MLLNLNEDEKLSIRYVRCVTYTMYAITKWNWWGFPSSASKYIHTYTQCHYVAVTGTPSCMYIITLSLTYNPFPFSGWLFCLGFTLFNSKNQVEKVQTCLLLLLKDFTSFYTKKKPFYSFISSFIHLFRLMAGNGNGNYSQQIITASATATTSREQQDE